MYKSTDKKFEDLKAKWYKKLKKSGFEDLENKNGDLKRYEAYHGNSKPSRHTPEAYKLIVDSRATYYRLAGHFLYDFSFETSLDKKIWEMHSLGKSMTTIAKVIKSISRNDAFKVISKLKKEMYSLYREQDNE